MQSSRKPSRQRVTWHAITALLCLAVSGVPAHAQQTAEPAPVELFEAGELQNLVAPVALYPDDLLAIVLPASTYPLQVVEAARFLEDRESDPGLQPDDAWDDSIIALLNYPEALQLLNDDLDWTWRLGEAVLAQQGDVLEAVEVFRDQAYLAGNLASDDYQRVERDADSIRIVPADPEVIYVPYYDPVRVTVRHSYPVYHYYERPYPVYYYPYDVGHRFYGSLFWGVTTAFSISWPHHYLHLNYYDHYRHPYYGRRYHFDRFYRHRRSIDYHVYAGGIRQRHRGDFYRWYPGRHHGSRPGYNRYRSAPNRRVLSYSNEGRARLSPRAERARRSNQERQRYRTFDNVIDRDRNRVRRGDARVERQATRRSGDARSTRQSRDSDGRTNRFAARGTDNSARNTRTERNRAARAPADRNARRDSSADSNGRFTRREPTTRTPRANAGNRATERAVRPNYTPRSSTPQRSTRPGYTQRSTAPQRSSRPGYTQRSTSPQRATRPAETRRAAPRTTNRSRPAEARQRNVQRRSAPARNAESSRRAAPRSAPRAERRSAERTRSSQNRSRSSSRSARGGEKRQSRSSRPRRER